jgi:hypothetical protein
VSVLGGGHHHTLSHLCSWSKVGTEKVLSAEATQWQHGDGVAAGCCAESTEDNVVAKCPALTDRTFGRS